MKIELCGECASKLVAQDLKELYDSMTPVPVGMFSLDREENKKEATKFKKALKTVLDFYGGGE